MRFSGVKHKAIGCGSHLPSIAGLACLFVLWSVVVLFGQAPSKDSCLECHAALDPPLGIAPEKFAQDIHAQKGVGCAGCHGGDSTSMDPERSMSRGAGFRRDVSRTRIPALCATCHSDAAYMRQFNPSLRTDQLSQYKTSVHGKRLAGGDTKVAVCIDCHGVHDLRPAKDPRSQVHPVRAAETCARCHADAGHMKDYKIPTDQLAGYRASAHHEALAIRGDLSAPTCPTCHGNHGAAPPGVAAVEFVCSTCHVFQAQLFDDSPHKDSFSSLGLPTCATCHSNHRIAHATDAMLGTGQQSVCLNCHSPGEPGYEAATKLSQRLDELKNAVARSASVLDQAERSGMEVSEARLAQAQARDALTKARVTIHSFQVAPVEQDISAGLKVTEATFRAGMDVLAERDYRRKGLALSLLTVLVVLVGLRLFIRELEAGQQPAGPEKPLE